MDYAACQPGTRVLVRQIDLLPDGRRIQLVPGVIIRQREIVIDVRFDTDQRIHGCLPERLQPLEEPAPGEGR